MIIHQAGLHRLMKSDDSSASHDFHDSKNLCKNAAANGFTLIETLCALLCTLTVFMLCTAVLQSASQVLQNQKNQVVEFAVLQLREEAANFDQKSVEHGILRLENAAESFEILLDQDRLVKKTGYEILMFGVENAAFVEEGNEIYLEMQSAGRFYRWQIA